jgi:alkanesulfonate monooxygenase SsuD/methylene tetrahydromethanopterin reductase-like flavin-dependent oxidoreductase (luciferase family)
MKVGIGLPNTVPGVEGPEMRDWAMRAEAAGFSTLGTIDRLVYPNHEPLVALSFAAAVTERIGLMTSMLLAPLRANAALLAKQAASLDVLSGGRLVLGVAVGGREDDFDASGLDFHARGRTLDRQLEDMQGLWRGAKVGFAGGVGPQPRDGRPELVIGGASAASYRRAARFGSGWMMGGGSHDLFHERVEGLRAAWSDAGREDAPSVRALGYYALGPDPREQARRYIEGYYGFLGDQGARGFGDSIPADADAIRATRDAFAAAGCDEFIFFPTSSEPAQVDLLAEVVLEPPS